MRRLGSCFVALGSCFVAVACCAYALASSPIFGAESAAPPAAAGAPPPPQGTEFGFAIYEKNCTGCHGNPAVERAPSPAQLRQFTPERIYAALTSGPMKSIGDTLTDGQRRQVAVSLAGRPLGAAAAAAAGDMPNQCGSNSEILDTESVGWNGWGADLANTRFQPSQAAQLPVEAVAKLKLKWVFGLPNASSAYSQPTIVAGRLFVGSDTGYVYALDARSGCVYWSYLAQAGVRNAMTLGKVRNKGRTDVLVYFGDLKANAYALDARTGQLVWTTKVEDNYTDRITAAPAYYDGRVFVPVSSWEEFAASSPSYPCCTSVGSVVALDASTGKRLWKTYVIKDRPHPVRKNSTGIQQWAPAGGSVWNTPTIDAQRGALYIGTGDATTYPAADSSDSVMALSLSNGRVLWSYQVHKGDSYVGGCWGPAPSDNCPKVEGPDWDVPASIIMRRVADKDYLLVGTKPGDILALDPTQGGKLLWRKNVSGGEIAGDAPKDHKPGSPPPRTTGVLWGGAADLSNAYFGLSGGGGLAAMRIVDGERVWFSSLGQSAGVSNAAATTAIPGVIFVGSSTGVLKAVSSADGSDLWDFDTNRDFSSVNHVPTHGGSISSAGAVVAGGMVYVGSGYAVLGGSPGNAILAFGAE